MERRLKERRRRPPELIDVISNSSRAEPNPRVTRWALIVLGLALAAIALIALVGVTLLGAPVDQTLGFLVLSGVVTLLTMNAIRTGHIRGRNNSPGISRSSQPIQFWSMLAFQLLFVVFVEWMYLQSLLRLPDGE